MSLLLRWRRRFSSRSLAGKAKRRRLAVKRRLYSKRNVPRDYLEGAAGAAGAAGAETSTLIFWAAGAVSFFKAPL